MASRILIADDSVDNRRLIATTLSSAGYELLEAADGQQAVATARGERPDLIILDVMMPEFDGYEVCRRLREYEETAFIPVIFLSALGEEDERIKGLLAGGDDFMVKPFSVRELRARVESHLVRTQLYLDANPSTRLPGGNSLNAMIRQCIEEQQSFATGYADIDNFKAYNDHAGFVFGDRVIRFTAGVVRTAVSEVCHGDELAYPGHIGGDDFIYLVQPEKAVPVAERIVELFREGRNKFHSQAEIDQGYFLSKDRQGMTVEYPLLSISVAVITKAISHVAELSQAAAELKHLAKAQGGGCFVADDVFTCRGADGLVVLVGEAERLRAKMLKDALSAAGFQVFITHNGPDLIKEAHRLNPAGIVVGRSLPMLGTREAKMLLNRLEATRQVPLFDFGVVGSGPEDVAGAVAELSAKLKSKNP